MDTLGGLLSSIFTGALGANQLFGGGPTSVSGSAAAGASAASPFGGQFAGYQPQLQQAVSGQQGNIAANQGAMGNIIQQMLGMGGNATMQGLQGIFQNPLSVGSNLTGSPGALQSQVNALANNYMSNPAIQAQYKLGLDAATRGLASQGLMGSGQEMVELSQYGQQFASNAYQQQLQNLLGVNQQVFGQNLSNLTTQAGLQQQQFGQGATLQQLLGQSLSGAGALQGQLGSQTLGAQGNLIQQLLAASGATTGSPATAGGILSGQFGNAQQGAVNLGQGVTGALTRLLGGGQGGTDLAGIGRQLSRLLGGGSNIASSIGGLGDLFGGSGIFGGSYAGGAGFGVGDTLGSMFGTGSYLPGLGDITGGSFDLGGALLGFNEGTGAAAASGAAESGAAAGTSGLGGAAALTAAPFALAIAGMLGGIFGYSDQGTPYSNANEAWANLIQQNPSLLNQYGIGNVNQFMQSSYGAVPSSGYYSNAQYEQAQQQLMQMSSALPNNLGVGWWMGGSPDN